MTPVLVLRPAPGNAATLAAARAQGLAAEGHPLFAVRPIAWDAPPADSFDALLLGSANALRHAGRTLAAYRDKPAYAVGATTAAAARDAGLAVAAVGTGGLANLLPALSPAHPRLLRLSGRERVALTPPPGVTIAERVVYASEPLPLSPALAARLRRPAVVLLHSAEAAAHFARLCDEAGIARARLSLAALGPRIAAAAGTGWGALASAGTPSDPALLALARDLCHTPR